MTTMLEAAPDYAAIKKKQNAAWSAGDYAVVGTTLQIVGENLAEAVDLTPGSSVLDVAAGNGNATLAFARRWNKVTSTDYVGALLERGRARAEAEALAIDFKVADAEDLPFEDGSFHGVVSTFGVMFTPNQHQSASELIRVCRDGGRIGLANWTPESFIGQLFKIIGSHVPPPAGVRSPANWGDREWLGETFGPHTSSIEVTEREFVFRYQSAEHFLEVFKTLYGPMNKAFLSLDEQGRSALQRDILDLVNRQNRADDGSMAVPAAYLEVVMTK